VYGRTIDGRELTFEPSGALLDASLVMRDRETDSWWSIMTSDAIGGALVGAELDELPVSEKTTWGEWRGRHPESLVLSVDGVEHPGESGYTEYFESAGTFRDLIVDDDRLAPKEPIYAFWLDGAAWAVPHRAIEGGLVVEHPAADRGMGRMLVFHRPPGAAVYASSRAWVTEGEVTDRAALVERIATPGAVPPPGAEAVDGFDTYWYTWVAVQEETGLLAGGE
jgi:hypothetical protein